MQWKAAYVTLPRSHTGGGGGTRRGWDIDDSGDEYHEGVITAPETKAIRSSISYCRGEGTSRVPLMSDIENKCFSVGELTDRDCKGAESFIAEMRWCQGR